MWGKNGEEKNPRDKLGGFKEQKAGQHDCRLRAEQDAGDEVVEVGRG